MIATTRSVAGEHQFRFAGQAPMASFGGQRTIGGMSREPKFKIHSVYRAMNTVAQISGPSPSRRHPALALGIRGADELAGWTTRGA